MKVGTTAILLVELDVDVTRVSKVIWTLKTPNATVQKEYPTDVTYADKHFGIPLTQQETTSLGVGTVKVEGQINYTDLAVTKTITAHFKMHETIATSLVTGNKPNGDTDISELRIKLVGEAIVAYTDGSGGSGGSGTSWGNITGTLSAQTDLKNALDGKANVNQIPSLTGYATENYVTNAISDKADRSEIPSLTGYATQSWVQNQGYTTSEIDDNTTGVTNTWSASKINQNLSDLGSETNYLKATSNYLNNGFEDFNKQADWLFGYYGGDNKIHINPTTGNAYFYKSFIEYPFNAIIAVAQINSSITTTLEVFDENDVKLFTKKTSNNVVGYTIPRNTKVRISLKGNDFTNFYVFAYGDIITKHSDETIALFGDSLYASANEPLQSFGSVIQQNFNFGKYVGVSIGGCGFLWGNKVTLPDDFTIGDSLPRNIAVNSSGTSNASLCSWERINSTLPSDADIVIIGTGTNNIAIALNKIVDDRNFYTSETMTTVDTEWVSSDVYSTYNGDYNLDTLGGAIRSTIMKVQAKCPNAKIFLSNWCNSRGTYGVSEPEKQTLYYSQTQTFMSVYKSVASDFGIEFIDLFSDGGINPLNRKLYTIDTIHLNYWGYTKKMARPIVKAIKGYYNE